MTAVILTAIRFVIDSAIDVLPIIAFMFAFQWLVIGRALPNWKQILAGFVFVVVGLGLFLEGLEESLFPLGRLMAEQLTRPEILLGSAGEAVSALDWRAYYWVYLFAFSVGFSTALAEPSLIAVAMKANTVSGGAIGFWGLRIAVALGVGLGVALGCFRIVTGMPIVYFMAAGYFIVVVQTAMAPRLIVPLAYDSGGVSTSTVTVPLVAALGLGLSEAVPGRNPLFDGFGLVAFACLFPIISVLAYGQLASLKERRTAQGPAAPEKEKDHAL